MMDDIMIALMAFMFAVYTAIAVLLILFALGKLPFTEYDSEVKRLQETDKRQDENTDVNGSDTK